MRISDWSSDVCSSDLSRNRPADCISEVLKRATCEIEVCSIDSSNGSGRINLRSDFLCQFRHHAQFYKPANISHFILLPGFQAVPRSQEGERKHQRGKSAPTERWLRPWHRSEEHTY